tara:strand:+ start:117 stop:542 length:426 start_codon:yes stop_codon:yes gene_type:complete
MVGMKKSEEVKEAIRQEILQRRCVYIPDDPKIDEEAKPYKLIQDLIRDYEDLKANTIWKLIFTKRQLEKIRQKYHNSGASSVNEKRLKIQLARTIRFLDVINQRIYKVEALEGEAIHLSLTYEQRAKISNVFDMSHKDFFE